MSTSHKAFPCPFSAARFILPTVLLLLTTAHAAVAQDAHAPRRESAQQLWLALQPLVASHDERAARSLIAREPEAARALYRELLFETATSALYETPVPPGMEEARALLAESDADARALESKYDAWRKDARPGVGFSKDGSAVEQMIYLAHVAKLRGDEKEVGTDAPPGTPRELTERALSIAGSDGNELAVASFSGTLAVYALRERRLDDVTPLVARAEEIWRRWQHGVGLFQAPLVLAYRDLNAEKWKDAASEFAVAADRAKAFDALRTERVNALEMLAVANRNAGDKEGVLNALNEAFAEQTRVVAEAKDDESRLKQSKTLASLEVEVGGALAALARHVEATDWYVRAEALKKENYKAESAQLESQLVEYQTKLQARIAAEPKEASKKILRSTLTTITDTLLSLLDTAASQAGDTRAQVKIAERRLAAARESANPTNIADALENVSSARGKAGDAEGARAAALEALRMRESEPRRTRIYQTLTLLGSLAADAEDWGEAVARYEEVVRVTQAGVVPPPFDLDAQADEGIRRVQSSMNSLDRLARANSALDAKIAIAQIRMQQGNYRVADELLTDVEQSVPRLYAVGAPDEAELSKWIADEKNPNITGAEVYAHRRLTGFTPDKNEEQRFGMAEMSARAERGSVLHYRASLYESQNDLSAAAATYERAHTLAANLVGGSFTLSGTYVALARIARERGDLAAAEPPVAAALAEAVRRNEPDTTAHLLTLQSALRREEGKTEEAFRLANDALNIARKLNQRSLVALTLRSLGRAEFELGGEHLKDSEAHLRESVARWRESGLTANAAYSLDSLGQTLEREGRDAEALAAYLEAVGIVEGMVVSLPPGASTETFNSGRGNRELYDHLIKLLIRKNRVSDAFQYLERSKSKSLVDALAGASVRSKDPALDALLGRVKQASDALRKEEKNLTGELSKPDGLRDDARAARARARVEVARGAYNSAIESLRRADAAAASLVAVRPTNLDEIRLLLPSRTLLVSYFPTDKTLYIFLVTRDRAPEVRSVALTRADVSRMVGEYRKLVVPDEKPLAGSSQTEKASRKEDEGPDRKDPEAKIKDPEAKTNDASKSKTGGVQVNVRGLASVKSLAGAGLALGGDMAPVKRLTARLYDALLAPAQDEIERAETILVVPSGDLYYLPVHALGRARADGSIDYIIETKRVAYLASADILNAVAAHAGARAPAANGGDAALLALGNPDGSLPGASQEVAAISHIFNGAQVFTGKQATVERVEDEAHARVPFIHFATHGVINSRDPKESYLLLAGDPGRLSVRDLVENTYKLSLDGTRLVTLSACNTNIGGLDPGAAYGSLSRAFSKAGAPTVIASLWSVDDGSTRDTMTVFYRELAAGTPKAEALRRAQLSVMHDPRYAHPFFWAPFLMLGEWR